MSHFTVLVIGDDVDGQLAPYDENITVAPTRSYVEDDDLQRAREYVLGKGGLPEGVDPDDPASYWEYWEDWSGQPLRFDEVGNPYILTTYNQASRWDWYTIGGRWAGSLLLKPGAKAVSEPDTSGWTWKGVSQEELEALKGRADQALKDDIDIDGMRDQAGVAAAKVWDTVYEAIKDLPKAKPWQDFVALGQSGEKTWDEVRKEYHEQPRVQAFSATKVSGFMGPGLEEFEIDRDLYVHRSRLQAVPGFATLHFGEWFEPGTMGWFGSSSDTPETRQSYGEYVNKLIDAAADDVLFSMVDCHI